MTTPEPENKPVEPETVSTPAETPENPETAETPVEKPEHPEGTPEQEEEEDERKRRWLLILLLLLLVCLCCVGALFVRYIMKPKPLPEMLLPTQVGVCYQPTYKSSIPGVDNPVSLAVSPDDQRLYVAEGSGNRLVKAFDRDGNLLFSFAPPGTDKANREPKYMAIDATGRIFLVDRTSSAIDIYDPNGNLIDAIIGRHLTLTKYLSQKIGTLPAGTRITHYEGINKILTYQLPGGGQKSVKVVIPATDLPWSPLGLRFNAQGDLIYTDTTAGTTSVNIITAADLETKNLLTFNPQIKSFGSQGKNNNQFDFPQTVVLDGQGNYYISDGNNSRIDVWTPDMQYKTFFGFGSSVNGALNLPRGTWMGRGNCLHVADAVGSLIRVYNVAGAEPSLAFEIGGYGIAEGQFNYPVDVFIDGTGRLYVADRANNRIQVWSY